jgi:hypothetical protein
MSLDDKYAAKVEKITTSYLVLAQTRTDRPNSCPIISFTSSAIRYYISENKGFFYSTKNCHFGLLWSGSGSLDGTVSKKMIWIILSGKKKI